MVIGIDASNLRAGGGITHIVELLNHSDPQSFGIKKIIIWGNNRTLAKIKDNYWLSKSSNSLLNGNLFQISLWKIFFLKNEFKKAKCDLLLDPAGTFLGKNIPYVSISQNLLIFDKKEASRYGISARRLKLIILRIIQTISFKRSEGIIFLTNYCKDYVTSQIKLKNSNQIVIPHGIGSQFFNTSSTSIKNTVYDFQKPFKFLYVSSIDVYKHQLTLSKAFYDLRKEGIPCEITFIGQPYYPYLKKLNTYLEKVDPTHSFIKLVGEVEYEIIDKYYREVDAIIFASTCEAFSIILVESMASGLPILISNHIIFQEIIQSSLSFDPELQDSIKKAVKYFIQNEQVRIDLARNSFNRAKEFSWENTATLTMKFLSEIVLHSRTTGMPPKNESNY